jgi:hypothetical protein
MLATNEMIALCQPEHCSNARIETLGTSCMIDLSNWSQAGIAMENEFLRGEDPGLSHACACQTIEDRYREGEILT